MYMYHSRLTQDDLHDLVIKYKITRDLHPRLPSEEFVMSELLDDAIGIYHRMFDFSGVCIPFSSFLLALIKHYRVHFSQLGPLGLNKFSFAKRRVLFPVCIDDNHSCMRHWKSGFFLIDRRAILDSMVWRHPSAAINDPRPATGSFSMADVLRLSAHVVNLRDMPEGVLVLSGSSRVWKSRVSDPVLRGADGNGNGHYGPMILNAPSVGVNPPRVILHTCSSWPFRDALRECYYYETSFLSLLVPYCATYPEGGWLGICEFTREEWDAPYRPTFGVLTKEAFKDPAVCKTSPTLKKQVFGLNDKLSSSDSSFAKSKAKGKEKKKKIKSLTKSLDNMHAEVARLFADLNRANVLEAEKDEEILRLKATPPKVQGELLSLAASTGFERGLSMHRTKDEFAAVLKKMANFMPGAQDRFTEASPLLEPKKLARLANFPTSRDARVSPLIAKESTVTPASISLELSTNVAPAPSAVTLE
ncbi:hypothetical protein Tco_1109032 [Tanacetum coccineum]